MDWNTIFGAGLGLFTWVATMIWPTLPKWLLTSLLIISVCLIVAWPVNVLIGLLRQYAKPPYGLIVTIAFGAIAGGVIAGIAYHLTPMEPETSPFSQRVERTEEEILAQEKAARSPQISIEIHPSNAPRELSPYKLPLKLYQLLMQNTNANSVRVDDLRVEFHFRNIITEVKPQVLLDTGNIIVGGTFLYGQRKDGSIDTYEENASHPDIAKKYSFHIRQATLNKKVVNLNFVDLYSERMIQGSAFIADIVVDTSKAPSFPTKPGRENSYSGKYSYEIRGKQFSGEINGSIAD